MHPVRAFIATLMVAVLTAGVLSCSDQVTAPDAPRLRELTAFPNPASIRVDETLVMFVKMVADSGADTSLEWASADPRRVTVSDNGILTGMSVGPAVVTVKSLANPGLIAVIPVNVMPAYTGVRGITLSPQSVSLLPGQTQAIAATVDADPKVSRDVKFEVDSPSVATVTTQGVVAAITQGVAHVTARSVADPSVSATLAVAVRAPTGARISIQSITAGGTTSPINLDNVRGQVDAMINIEPGEIPLDRVNLVVTNNGRDTIVASQNYAATVASARKDILRRAASAEDSALATRATVPIVLSFRTNAFDPTTGTVAFRNGAMSLKAVAVSTVPNAKQQEASSSVAATLTNLDGFIVSVRGLSSTGVPSATDAGGRRWLQAGRGLVFTTRPVLFSGRTVGGRTIAFPATAAVASVSSRATGESVDTLFLPTNFVSATAGDSYVSGELPSVLGTDDKGNSLSLVPSVTNVAGGPGFGVINVQPGAPDGTKLDGIRVDNAPPPPATFVISTSQQNVNNWVNAAYKFTSGLSGLVADAGVGLQGSNVAPTPESAGVAVLVTGGALTDTTEVITGSQLPPSPTNDAYTAVVRIADRLGNTRLIPLSGAGVHPRSTFGVDVQPPTLRYAFNALTAETLVSSSADSAFATPTGLSGPRAFAIDAIDDRSGLATGRVAVSLTRLAQPSPVDGFSGTTTCIVGTGNACSPTYVDYESVLPDQYRQYTQQMDGGTGVDGYYTFTATVQDQAGNMTAPRIKRALLDGTGASLTGLGIPGVLTGGQPAGFLALAVDNVEIAKGGVLLQYPNLPGTTQMFAYQTPQSGGTTIGTAFDALLTSPVAGAHAAFTVPNFIRGLESVSAADAPQAYPAATAKPTFANAWVTDFSPGAAPSTLAANVAIAPTSIQSPGANPGFAAATGTANELSFWRRVGTTGMAFEAVGVSGQSNSPFARVLLARLEPTGLAVNANVWRVVSELTTPVGQDNGLRRTWTYDFGSQSSGSYVAIGVSANGDAIVTQIITF